MTRQDEPAYHIQEEHDRRPNFLSGYILQLLQSGGQWAVRIIQAGTASAHFEGETSEHDRLYTGSEERARELLSRCLTDCANGLVPDPLHNRHRGAVKAARSEVYKSDGSWNRSKIMRRGHEIARSLSEDRDYSDRLSEGLTRAWDEARAGRSVGAEMEAWRGETRLAPDPRRLECEQIEVDASRKTTSGIDSVEQDEGDFEVLMRDRSGQTWALYLLHGRVIGGRGHRSAVKARADAEEFISTFERMHRFEEARQDFSCQGVGVSVGFAVDHFRSEFRDNNQSQFDELEEAWDLDDPDTSRYDSPEPCYTPPSQLNPTTHLPF